MATDHVVAGRLRRTGVAGRRAVARSPLTERGTVTAEAALVLPVTAMFVLALVWMLAVGIAKVQTVDAARDAARVLARGDGTEAAVTAAHNSAPQGAQVDITSSTLASVTVTVTTRATAPSWLLVPLPAVTVASAATTPVEAHGGEQR